MVAANPVSGISCDRGQTESGTLALHRGRSFEYSLGYPAGGLLGFWNCRGGLRVHGRHDRGGAFATCSVCKSKEPAALCKAKMDGEGAALFHGKRSFRDGYQPFQRHHNGAFQSSDDGNRRGKGRCGHQRGALPAISVCSNFCGIFHGNRPPFQL